MEDIFDPVYRQGFMEGYSLGLNPFCQLNFTVQNCQAFNSGFNSGRSDYERLNGKIANGIPSRIVTKKVLDEFQLAGMLGMNIDSEGYTPYQLNIIQEWYQSGIENYDVDESLYLLAILESNGIQTM
ncbi:hypothetical protein [Flavobacterium sp. UMI-01]|uniref:hypothetical protein n=1 Tax=Flavobacterium sp. UMI-01 TaxID=1441053 RepID=UPI001C7D0323|nr:hypothetical protein [Flavobacterium sp. UMI-01]GIZ10474.1 hypothetical protein FUMI01_31980 [Flavobacterium sp. UMI-01]